MQYLNGPQAPTDWKGEMSVNYKIGGSRMNNDGNLKMNVTNELKIKTVRNIVTTIRGLVEPDRYVVIGSRRNSWGYGATESATGTAIMMEIAAAIYETMKSYGWRPRRTLIFVSFGASEFSNVGSREWIEEHLPKLKNRYYHYVTK